MVSGFSQVNVTVPVDHKSVCPHEQSRRVESVVHGFTYFQLHLFYFEWWVTIVGWFRKISRTESLKFLQFGGDKHRSGTCKLKIRLGQIGGLLKVLVGKRYSQMESFPLKPELITNMHHPINKNGPHEPVQIFLPQFNVIGLHNVFCLSLLQTNYGFDFGRDIQLSLNHGKLPQFFFVTGQGLNIKFSLLSVGYLLMV